MPSYPSAIRERLELEVEQLKKLLDITTDQYDEKLGVALKAAKRAADDYCNNPFEDEDGNEEPIPEDVLIGVVVYCKRVVVMREPGLTADSVLGRSKQWPDDPRLLEDVAHGYWWPHRLTPGF